MKKIAILLASTLLAGAAVALPPDSTIASRAARSIHEPAALLTVAWENPAVNQWRRDYSISDIAARFALRDDSEPVDVQRGDREETWSFDARTYMKHRASTLWGRAFYDNGHVNHVVWNETSDLDVVAPYVLADAVGGRMNVERYSFMGGYASHNERWAWGGQLGYTAGLYYRDVDPRPRNVTASLTATAGGGYRVLPDAVLALSLNFEKYKQTNNVAFYSELGNEKLFHLTGLGNDYGRFAGTAYATYYKGYRWGTTLAFHPTGGRGLSVAATLSRFTLDNVLTTLNKLPMARVGHNELRAEAGWLDSAFAVVARVEAARRVGTENIFGDATAGVYPQFTSLDNYHENRFAVGLQSAWMPRWNHWSAELRPALGYRHLNIIYAEPQAQRQLNTLWGGLAARAGWQRQRVHCALGIGAAFSHALSERFLLPRGKDELEGLYDAIALNHTNAAANVVALTADCRVTVALNSRFALRATARYRRDAYHDGPTRQCVVTSLSLLF